MITRDGTTEKGHHRRAASRASLLVVLALASTLTAACTGQGGGGLASRTPASRTGGIALPTVQPTLPGGGGGLPSAEPTETNPPKSPKPQPTATEAPPTEIPVTVAPQVTVTQVIVTPSQGGNEQTQEEKAIGWVLLVLIIAIVIGLIALGTRRRGPRTDWTASAANAYRSCSTLRDRLAGEMTATTGTPWVQLVPLVDGASSTLYPLQTAPPDRQAAQAVTHAIEALSGVKLALEAGAATPTPSQEAQTSLLRALGQLDAALEPLRFEATGRSGPQPLSGQ
jgi:hypothetical protein